MATAQAETLLRQLHGMRVPRAGHSLRMQGEVKAGHFLYLHIMIWI